MAIEKSQRFKMSKKVHQICQVLGLKTTSMKGFDPLDKQCLQFECIIDLHKYIQGGIFY